jgi:hypothetical protein
MTVKVLQRLPAVAMMILIISWANAAPDPTLLTRIVAALALSAVMVADRVRHRPGRSGVIVELVTAAMLSCFLIWISRGGPPAVY